MVCCWCGSFACGPPQPASNAEINDSNDIPDKPINPISTLPDPPSENHPALSLKTIDVYPTSLTFYLSGPDPDTHDTLTLSITNLSNEPLLIRKAFILDNPTISMADGDRFYFGLLNAPRDFQLAPAASLSLQIRYYGSSEQKSAVLIIETSATNSPAIAVNMIGKVLAFH